MLICAQYIFIHDLIKILHFSVAFYQSYCKILLTFMLCDCVI